MEELFFDGRPVVLLEAVAFAVHVGSEILLVNAYGRGVRLPGTAAEPAASFPVFAAALFSVLSTFPKTLVFPHPTMVSTIENSGNSTRRNGKIKRTANHSHRQVNFPLGILERTLQILLWDIRERFLQLVHCREAGHKDDAPGARAADTGPFECDLVLCVVGKPGQQAGGPGSVRR